ncbi:hypothetical protein BDB00DRAFT_876707 [Zychaea mexicana]|uniref:uncharacterized protein n=1 Tax=Zychaea mexicana TaxID=64656 RepID=UPI0022FDC113|nr:uncharacterized protein BDB00DRAFT_876707 [Zychaea mexicana]KAI9489158.1 hypothetical protein BDB00DRAFT_876707 [Zychaea mexicana]
MILPQRLRRSITIITTPLLLSLLLTTLSYIEESNASALPDPTKFSANCFCKGGKGADFAGYNGRATRTCCDSNEMGFYFTFLDFCIKVDPARQNEYKDCCTLNNAMDAFCSGPAPNIFPET